MSQLAARFGGATVARLAAAARLAPLGWVLVALAACGPGATPRPTAVGLTSPIDGVVLTIDATGLSQVHGFTLRTAAGETLTFTIGSLENPAEFPPGHLAEHQANALPVRVSFVVAADGALVAYRLDDAPRASPTP